MARLHEYQGKALLQRVGIAVPRGVVARTAEEAKRAAEELGGRVILKVQAWITGRKSKGGVQFANSPEEAARHAEQLLAMTFGNFPVKEVLVEELMEIRDELFVSLSIDDAAQAPVLLLDCQGGSGIEDRAASVVRLPVDVAEGVSRSELEAVLCASPVEQAVRGVVSQVIVKLVEVARTHEARSLEVNPLVTTRDGGVVAADCRMTIDDYAVFRQPDLGIEIARELDHPATELERIAYGIEQADHRGTFYFAQLPTDGAEKTRGLIGFHGAGGGGSMMSMDAISNVHFTLANFCDTSGNPSAAKVYRAARIIMSQPGLVGYFGSGSGVASQEQFWSAYGLAKAFIELHMPIPAVIRLGGNSEDRAVEILEDACRKLPARVEGYKKDDTPAYCAQRFASLVAESTGRSEQAKRSVPAFVGSTDAYKFAINGGCVWIDHARCDGRATACVLEHGFDLLHANADGKPVIKVDEATIAGKDSELIACEIECWRAGITVVFVDLSIPGLDA